MADDMPDQTEDDSTPDAETADSSESQGQAPVSNQSTSAAPIAPVASPQVAPVHMDAPQLNQNLNQDALDFHNDINSGAIHPQTLQGLYHNQDLGGKAATIFGLLLGGAGSGLTHQPNQLLDQLNKQINNDLEAQKATAANKQNWYKLALEHQLQQAQIPLIQAQTGQAQAGTKESLANAALIATNIAKTGMSLDLLKKGQDLIDRLAPGPNKQAAQNTFDTTVKPYSINEIQNRNSQVAQQVGAINANNPMAQQAQAMQQAAQSGQDMGVDFNKLQALKGGGATASALGIGIIPGQGLSESDAARAQQEAGHVVQNRTLYNNFANTFQKLDNDWLTAGRLNPADRKALIDPLAAQLVKLTGVGGDEANKVANSLFPEAGDWGDTRQDKWKALQDKFKFYEADTPVLDANGLKTPFPQKSLQQIRQKSMSAQDQAALQWANSNPNDPRAAQIKQKLGQGQP